MRRSTSILLAMLLWPLAGAAQPAKRTGADARANAANPNAPLPPSPAPTPAPAPEKPRSVVADIPQPAASKPTPSAPVGAPAPVDLDKLRADYDRLREELFRSQARAQLVAEVAYPARLSATLRWKGGADQLIRHAQIRLDGGEVWDSGDKPVTGDLISVAERGIKPGPHALTVRLEIHPGKKIKDAEKLGYVSEHTFAVIVPDKTKTRVSITADEDGDPPEYEPSLDVEIKSEK